MNIPTLLGYKVRMTQVYDDKGVVHAVTVIKTAPHVVTQIKNKQTDGYDAVQVGFGVARQSVTAKAQIGHVAKANAPTVKHLKEIVLTDAVSDTETLGGAIDPFSALTPGSTVTVSGISKGKGFQGVVKRHGFKGGRRSHGQKHSEREAGSIGGGGRAGGRVAKGMRMPGRMGGDRITVKNLSIVQVLPEQNEILISGAVPGRRGTLLEITVTN